jgi:putative colanic acid biosynthesis acetyltransferase WcaF
MSAELDIAANRSAQKYTAGEMRRRILWGLVFPFFRFSPRPLFAWRNWILRRFGAQIGRNVQVYNTVSIQYPWLLVIGDFSAVGDSAIVYNLGLVSIGSRVTVSQYAHLCAGTHDYTCRDMPLKKLPIVIADDAWVCADAFIAPGVTVGCGAVVGARAAVFADVEPWTVVGGNPARMIKRRELSPPRS